MLFDKQYYRKIGYLTSRECFALLGVQRGTVLKWYKRGLVFGVMVGRELLFKRSDIEALISERSHRFKTNNLINHGVNSL